MALNVPEHAAGPIGGRPGAARTLLAVAPLTIMAGATVAPSLPEMGTAFAAVPAADTLVRLVLTITALTSAVAATFMGFFADRFGRKPLLLASLLLYALAGASSFVAPDLRGILIGRSLLGVAVSGLMTAGSDLAADYFSGPERAAFMGRQAALTSVGGVLFVLLGGVLADVGWRTPFLVYLGALVLIPVGQRTLHDAPRGHAFAGEAGLVRAGERSVWFIYGLALVTMLVYYMVPTQIPFLLGRLGVTPTGVGLLSAAGSLAAALVALVFGYVRRLGSPPRLAASGLGIVGLAWVLISTAPALPQVALGLVVFGVGAGVLLPNFTAWLAAVAPGARRGRLLGGLTTALFLGQFLSPLAVQPLVVRIGLADTFLAVGLGTAVVAALLMAARAQRLPEK